MGRSAGRAAATAVGLALFALMCSAFLVAAPAGAAQTGAPPATISVETAFDNQFHPGADTPLIVRVSARRVFDGTVKVEYRSGDGERLSFIAPIELAAGTTRSLVVVVPGLERFGTGVTAKLVENNHLIDEVDLDAVATVDDFVGVFDATSETPEQVSLAAEVGTARLFDLDPAQIDRFPASITGLQAIVVSERRLERFDSDGGGTIDSILTWVFQGGTLLIDSPAGTTIAGLPDVAQPGAAGVADYGLGRIIASATTLGQDIGGLIPASSSQSVRADGEAAMLVGDVVPFAMPLAMTTVDDAGAELFEVRWVGAALGAYAIVLVPLLWTLLRRRSRAWLVWISLAGSAVAIAGLVWFVGTRSTTGSDDAHATTIEIAPHRAHAMTTHLVTSRAGGPRTIPLPDRWRATTSTDSSGQAFGRMFGPMFGPGGNQSEDETVEVASAFDGAWITTEVEAGSMQLLHASGPVAGYAGAIELVARTDGNAVVGTVTNHLDIDLHEVGLFADLAGTNIGTVAAGESLDFELTGQPRVPFNGPSVEGAVWPTVFGGFEGPFPPQPATDEATDEPSTNVINAALWSNYVNGYAGSARPRGQLVVAAWTDELESPVTPEPTPGRTLLVARTVIRPDGPINNLSMLAELVRPRSDTPRDFESTLTGMDIGGTWRFRAPAGVTPSDRDMVLKVPMHSGLAIWVGDEWVEIGLKGRATTMQLPGEAFVGPNGSELYLRMFARQNNGPVMGLRPRSLSVIEEPANGSVVPFTTYADHAAEEERLAAERRATQAARAAEAEAEVEATDEAADGAATDSDLENDGEATDDPAADSDVENDAAAEAADGAATDSDLESDGEELAARLAEAEARADAAEARAAEAEAGAAEVEARAAAAETRAAEAEARAAEAEARAADAEARAADAEARAEAAGEASSDD